MIYKVTPAGRETILHRFPYIGAAALARDSAGNLYGGAGKKGTPFGQVFRLSPAGQYTVLYTFTGGVAGDGTSGVILDSAGNLYGTSGPGATGAGLVFRLSPSGQYTVLHSFTGPDGSQPNGQLTLDPAGNLYGTTNGGGLGYGVVYKIAAAGEFTVLYRFTGGADGGVPLAGVTVDPTGNLYSAASGYGRLSNGNNGSGVVFELDAAGAYNVLYTFTGGVDGAAPESVVRDSAGDLYGTTKDGGGTACNSGLGCGVVFGLSAAGTFTVLHTFTGGADGSLPYTSPILGPNGELYGTTGYGGTANGGVVYKITP